MIDITNAHHYEFKYLKVILDVQMLKFVDRFIKKTF